MEKNKKTSLTRRDALKTLAVITGAATLASLPARWQTPLVQVGALPAHAQCSFIPGTVTFDITNNSPELYSLGFRREGYNNSVTVSPNGGMGCLTGIPVGVLLALTETACNRTLTGAAFFRELDIGVWEVEVNAEFCNGNGTGGLLFESLAR